MKNLSVIRIVMPILFLNSACTSNITKSLQCKQEVLIESLPTDSDIYINGEFIGKTPMKLNLNSDISHEINFKKVGFKSAKESIGPIYKYEEKPFLQFGFAKDLGYYYRLSKDHIIAELPWEHLPNSAGIVPFETMGKLITKADSAFHSGDLSSEDHKIVIHQIISFFDEL